ncbi:hypothetical protein B1207_03900 [Legionella quinlivanii]|uniref:Uncharacterized protein n=2 Tax=Legionella quinlivanii TaxID=45073 RepID=A0A364LKV2_9GAMM|nr:hypothetical protein B1207_03900 [Legionella quinlivanii]
MLFDFVVMKEKQLSIYAVLENDTINFREIDDLSTIPLANRSFHAEHQLAELFNKKPVLGSGNFQTRGVKCNRAQKKLIKFDQAPLCAEVKEKKDHYADLHKINLKFNGLCELICNFVIMEDKLGKASSSTNRFSAAFAKTSFEIREDDGLLSLIERKPMASRHRFNVSDINKSNVKKSHILHVSTFFQKVIAYFFNIYPHDLFKPFESNQKDGMVNETRLAEKLNALPDGHYVKFSVFRKGRFEFEGHSMVIKKTGGTYSFFDPNEGEYIDLSFDELCQKINHAMQKNNGTHMAFIDGKAYVESLQVKDDLSIAPGPA